MNKFLDDEVSQYDIEQILRQDPNFEFDSYEKSEDESLRKLCKVSSMILQSRNQLARNKVSINESRRSN
jgi:hypothetical protein